MLAHTAVVIETRFRCRQPRSFSPSAMSGIYYAVLPRWRSSTVIASVQGLLVYVDGDEAPK